MSSSLSGLGAGSGAGFGTGLSASLGVKKTDPGYVAHMQSLNAARLSCKDKPDESDNLPNNKSYHTSSEYPTSVLDCGSLIPPGANGPIS